MLTVSGGKVVSDVDRVTHPPFLSVCIFMCDGSRNRSIAFKLGGQNIILSSLLMQMRVYMVFCFGYVSGQSTYFLGRFT